MGERAQVARPTLRVPDSSSLQVAFAFSLLVAAGVLIQSFGNLQDLDRGIRTENVLAVRLTVPEKKFPGEAKLVTHLVQILEELRALPGVRSAAAINELPATGYINWAAQFTVDGRPAPPTGQEYICQVRTIGPDYFRTIGIGLLAGRDFSSDDTIDEPDVIVINETLAAQHFSAEDPVGKFLSIRGREGSAQIIAVVADVRQAGPREPIRPSIYYSYRQRPPLTTSMVVRTENRPAGLVPAIRSAVAASGQQSGPLLHRDRGAGLVRGRRTRAGAGPTLHRARRRRGALVRRRSLRCRRLHDGAANARDWDPRGARCGKGGRCAAGRPPRLESDV